MRSRFSGSIARCVSAIIVSFISVAAFGAGLYAPARGGRPLGRGGAYVAGADDANAVIYNPAGIADIEGGQLLTDIGLLFQNVTYTRVDSGGNTLAPVTGDKQVLPIPTIMATYKHRLIPKWTFSFGVYAPYTALNSYSEKGSQRYSAVSKGGSLILTLAWTAAYKIRNDLWIGFGLQNQIVKLREKSVLSSCTELNCAPEDPSFDTLTEANVLQMAMPSGNFGIIYARPKYRLGLSVQLPQYIRAEGTVKSRLPSDPQFTNASVHGDSGVLRFWLPPIIRAGVEWRPRNNLRLELDLTYEGWSIEKDISVTPQGVYIDGITGIGRYYLPTSYVNRELRDTIAVNLGGEWEAIAKRLFVRGGYILETSSSSSQTASIFTPDALKNVVTVGLGTSFWKLKVDVGYAHVFYQDVFSDWRYSKAYQVNPIQPGLKVGVGGGTYSVSTDILTVGLTSRF